MPSLSHNAEGRFDVLVELRGESHCDGVGETSRDPAGGSVLNMEKVFDLVVKRKQLEGVERKADIGHQNGLSVRHSNSEVLKDYCLGLRDKRCALELATSNDLWLNHVFSLPDHCLSHVLLLEDGEFGMVVSLPDLFCNLFLLESLMLRKFEVKLFEVFFGGVHR